MTTTAERLKELANRLKTLETGCNVPVTDVEKSELQTAINDANVMHKYARAIEYELRGIYKKLFGEDWDPDGIAVNVINPIATLKTAYQAAGRPEDAVNVVKIEAPTEAEINEMNRQLGTDIAFEDHEFTAELDATFENHREAMKDYRDRKNQEERE
jgi:hypothetical protein